LPEALSAEATSLGKKKAPIDAVRVEIVNQVAPVKAAISGLRPCVPRSAIKADSLTPSPAIEKGRAERIFTSGI